MIQWILMYLCYILISFIASHSQFSFFPELTTQLHPSNVFNSVYFLHYVQCVGLRCRLGQALREKLCPQQRTPRFKWPQTLSHVLAHRIITASVYICEH